MNQQAMEAKLRLHLSNALIWFMADQLSGEDDWSAFLAMKEMTVTMGLGVRGLDDKTALHVAAGFTGSADQVKNLLSHGADWSMRDANGRTALHDAVAYPVNTLEKVRLLLEAGAQVDAHTAERQTPLHVLAHYGPVLQTAKTLAALLIGRGSDVNAQDSQGNTPLHYAAAVPKSPLLRMLLARGADVSIVNHENKRASEVAEEPAQARLLRKHEARLCSRQLKQAMPKPKAAASGTPQRGRF